MSEHLDYHITPSKRGAPTLFIIDSDGKKRYLHSSVDPLNEAAKFKKKLEEVDSEFLVILGFGLGYHLTENINLLKQRRKIVIVDRLGLSLERNRKVLSESLSSTELVFLDDLSLAEVKEELGRELDFDPSVSFSLMYHTNSLRVFENYYKAVEAIVKEQLLYSVSNSATINRFSYLFFKNILKKLKNLQQCKSLVGLKHGFSKYSVIVVSSAPSAALHLDKIKKQSSSYFIIAVDSAVRMLLQHGIVPDFYLSVDPQPWIEEHLIREDTKPCIRVSLLSSYPTKSKNKEHFIALNSHPLCQLLDHLYPNIFCSLDSKTGNVAGDALKLAEFLGFKSIVLCGVDLAFPYYTIYSRSSSYQDRYNFCFTNKFCTTEKYNIDYIFRSSGKEKRGRFYSRKSFDSYRSKIESEFTNQNLALLAEKEESLLGIRKVREIEGEGTLSKESILKELCSLQQPIRVDLKSIKEMLLNSEFQTRLFDAAAIGVKRHKKLSTIINNL